MKRTFLQFTKFLKYRRTQQVATLSLSLAAVRCIYQKYGIISCEEDKENAFNQNEQVASNQNEQIEEQQQQEQIEEEEEEESVVDIVRIKRYQDISDMIANHKTQTQCIVFMPKCSKETKQIILKSMQQKINTKYIKLFAFSPVNYIPNSKLEKREQEKQTLLNDKLNGVEFFAVNSFGDLKFFSLDSNEEDSSKQKGKQQSLSANFSRIMNFFSPPRLIGEREFPQLVQSIQDLPEEERIVLSYIPEEKVYEANLPRLSPFDSYRQDRVKNIAELERRFRDISYEYIEKNTKFIIIRNSDVAQSLSIGKDDAGEIYILKRTQNQMNNESNWFFHGKEYIYNKIEWDPNTDNKLQLSQNQIIEKLYQRSFNYVNSINTEQDLNNFLASSSEMGVKKILIYYSAEALEKEYESKLTKKLISVKKNIADQDFVVIFTKNPLLLKNVFRIIPDKYTDTIRLLDYSEKKGNRNQHIQNKYIDWTIQVSYSPHNNSLASKISKEEAIATNKTQYQLNSDDAFRYKYDGKTTRNKLTYFIKQSLLSSNFIIILLIYLVYWQSSYIRHLGINYVINTNLTIYKIDIPLILGVHFQKKVFIHFNYYKIKNWNKYQFLKTTIYINFYQVENENFLNLLIFQISYIFKNDLKY